MFISIVNSGKRPEILGQTQKWTNNHTRQKTIQKHARAHTHTNTHTHTHTHTYSLQYNITATLSISAERPEVNCYQAGPSTAGSGAVCLSDDRSISPGWRTDRWRLRGVMNGERNARKKKCLFTRDGESNLRWEAHTHKRDTHAVTHRMPICSHFAGLVLNYAEINRR